MKHIYVGDRKVAEFDDGMIVGYKSKQDIAMVFTGKMDVDQVVDLIMTATYDSFKTFEDVLRRNSKTPEQAEATIKEVYRRYVIGFSLAIDKAYPKGKDLRAENPKAFVPLAKDPKAPIKPES